MDLAHTDIVKLTFLGNPYVPRMKLMWLFQFLKSTCSSLDKQINLVGNKMRS